MKGCRVTVGSPDGWHFLGGGLLREETPEEGTRSPPCLGVGMQGGLGKERRLQGQAGLSAPPSHTAGLGLPRGARASLWDNTVSTTDIRSLSQAPIDGLDQVCSQPGLG